jgi:hypothetical protein
VVDVFGRDDGDEGLVRLLQRDRLAHLLDELSALPEAVDLILGPIL